MRVFSPYYGNTIYTVSSVITVILLALSIGYYAGGVSADRHPSRERFFGLILASGVVLLLLHIAGTLTLPAVSSALSIQVGPLVSAAMMFLLPALLLGMVSPYAIKLQALSSPQRGVGEVSGTIFFWSTLGSITGSLLAGFVLIPAVGVDRVFIAVGARARPARRHSAGSAPARDGGRRWRRPQAGWPSRWRLRSLQPRRWWTPRRSSIRQTACISRSRFTKACTSGVRRGSCCWIEASRVRCFSIRPTRSTWSTTTRSTTRCTRSSRRRYGTRWCSAAAPIRFRRRCCTNCRTRWWTWRKSNRRSSSWRRDISARLTRRACGTTSRTAAGFSRTATRSTT